MDEYRFGDARRGVTVERGTDSVPNDGRYHVLLDGEIVLSTKVEAAALAVYEEHREARRADAQQVLRRESQAADIRAHRSSSWAAKSSKDGKKGGRGVGRH